MTSRSPLPVLCLLLAAVALPGCFSEEGATFVLVNGSGAPLRFVSIDTGSGTLAFESVCAGCTVTQPLRIEREGAVRLSWRDPSGAEVVPAVDLRLAPSRNGGEVRFDVGPSGTVAVSTLRFARTATTDHRGRNVEQARRHYDALEIGMAAPAIREVLGVEPEGGTWRGGRDFGFPDRLGCLRVEVVVVDGALARVTLLEPCGGTARQILAEKGKAERELARR